MTFSAIENHITSLSIVEKITSNGYVYAELWSIPNHPNLDYPFFVPGDGHALHAPTPTSFCQEEETPIL